MTSDDKPRFEPPPWEQEAFERFREAQDAQKSQAELEAALKKVREAGEESNSEPSTSLLANAEGPSAEDAGAETNPASAGEHVASAVVIPEAEIDSMIIRLRGEERPAQRASAGLINGVIAFMAVCGLYIIIRSALLLGNVQATSGTGTLLAATLSFMVFATGLGFLGGAFLLYRKYHG